MSGTGSDAALPHVVVLSSLFPSAVQPMAGLFVRERMFRVGQRLPLAVVAPSPWFPLQGLLRRLRPGFRPGAPGHEVQQGHDIWFPQVLVGAWHLQGSGRVVHGVGAWRRLRALQREGRLDLLDAHFGYPDGEAAVRLGRWLKVPVTITMRGTEARHANDPSLRPLLTRALRGADRIFAVSESLRQVALGLGVSPERVRVVGNGVDLERFQPIDRGVARTELGLPPDARVLVSVGGLCERKGFHRVVDCLPTLRAQGMDAHLIVVGGPSPEGDWSDKLRNQVREAGLGNRVRFTGAVPSQQLHRVLSAADVFVLATRNEGWANVFLEAMACGLPVVTTDVGGNAEVVCRPELGTVVPFDDAAALTAALGAALARSWDRQLLRRHAQANTWDHRVDVLEAEFRALRRTAATDVAPSHGEDAVRSPQNRE